MTDRPACTCNRRNDGILAHVMDCDVSRLCAPPSPPTSPPEAPLSKTLEERAAAALPCVGIGCGASLLREHDLACPARYLTDVVAALRELLEECAALVERESLDNENTGRVHPSVRLESRIRRLGE